MTDGAPTRFEDRLLAELMPLVGAVPPGAVPPGEGAPGEGTPGAVPPGAGVPGTRRLRIPGYPLPAPRRRIVALLGVLLLVLAGFGVGTVLWPRQVATPAYAVEEQPDGSLVVTVNDLSDPRGLQNALAAHHVPAVVLVLGPATPPCVAPMAAVQAPGAIQGRPDHPNVLAIRPNRLPPGSIAVLGLFGGTSGGGTGANGTAGGGSPLAALFVVVRGPAPRCFPGAVPVQVPTS